MKSSCFGGREFRDGAEYRALDRKKKMTFVEVVCKRERDEQIVAAAVTAFSHDNPHTFIAPNHLQLGGRIL